MVPAAFFRANVSCGKASASGSSFVSSHTSVADPIDDVVEKVAVLLKRRALVHWYTGEGMDYGEMHEAQESLQGIVARYREAAVPSAGADVEVLQDGRFNLKVCQRRLSFRALCP